VSVDCTARCLHDDLEVTVYRFVRIAPLLALLLTALPSSR
jgi:hypothetical protein